MMNGYTDGNKNIFYFYLSFKIIYLMTKSDKKIKKIKKIKIFN